MAIDQVHFADGAVALITGAASGIGAAVVRGLHARGVRRFVLVDGEGAGLASSTGPLPDAQLLLQVHDVADEAAWRATAAAARARFGRLDLLVANAGITDSGLITEMPFAAWRRVLSTNLDGVFLTLQHGLAMIKEGGRGGACVVVSSAAALRAELRIAAYGASKAAVVQLAKIAAKECAPDQIRVNAILPGGVTTHIWRSVPSYRELARELGSEAAALESMGKAMPLGRYASAEEIAGQIAFLLSDAAALMTGASVVIDGGYSL